MTTIAIIGMGEMGAGIAGRLIERGARVVSPLAGRSDASLDRAKQAGVALLDDVDLVDQADMLLSIVPPVSATSVAAHYLPLIEAAATKPMFIDCNAIAPQTLTAIARSFADRGLPFGDGSIIGVAPKADYSPRLFLSGVVADQAATLETLGLDTRVVSDMVGEASALKMAFAGITKGVQAIGTAIAVGAHRSGTLDALIVELQHAVPDLYAWLAKMLPVMVPKAYRWDDEMMEIAKFLDPEPGAVEMLSGAGKLYRHVAEANRASEPSDIIAALDRFCGR